MKKLFLLFFVSFCLSAAAGEKVDQILDVNADGLVEIHNVRGEISVTGWSNNQVKITGTLDELTEKFIFTSDGDKTLIKVTLPRNSRHRSREGSKLKIMLPHASKVSFSGVATDLNMADIEGGIDINSVTGDIGLNRVKGNTYINSVSGELTLKALEGKMEVSTVSGDLVADGNCRKINVSGVSADLKIIVEEIESARVSTVSGDTRLSGRMLDDGEIKLSSVSGNAYYLVEGNLNARVMMETAPGGNITNDYSDDEPKSTFINSHTLNFNTGDGNGVIRMSTVSGDIGLKRK